MALGFFGALIASYIADKLGRRIGLMIAALVTIVGVVMQSAASGSIPCMVGDGGRVGSGTGADLCNSMSAASWQALASVQLQ